MRRGIGLYLFHDLDLDFLNVLATRHLDTELRFINQRKGRHHGVELSQSLQREWFLFAHASLKCISHSPLLRFQASSASESNCIPNLG